MLYMVFEETQQQIRNFKYTKNVTKGLFFLLLGISSNFIGDTMGCQIQQLFTENTLVKQIIVFLTILFGIDLSDSSNKTLNLKEKLFVSGIVFVIFTILANMDYQFSLIAFSLITALYLVNEKVNDFIYKKVDKDEEIKDIKKNSYQELRKNISIILIATIIIGFTIYFTSKQQKFGKDFDIIKFIFGQSLCNFDNKLNAKIDFF